MILRYDPNDRAVKEDGLREGYRYPCWLAELNHGTDYHGNLFALAPEMAAMLRFLEWAAPRRHYHPSRKRPESYEIPACPVCRGYKPIRSPNRAESGHTDDCELAALLARIPAQESEE